MKATKWVFFTDEKVFYMNSLIRSQNNWVWQEWSHRLQPVICWLSVLTVYSTHHGVFVTTLPLSSHSDLDLRHQERTRKIRANKCDNQGLARGFILLRIKPRSVKTITSINCYQSQWRIFVICWETMSYFNTFVLQNWKFMSRICPVVKIKHWLCFCGVLPNKEVKIYNKLAKTYKTITKLWHNVKKINSFNGTNAALLTLQFITETNLT